MTTLDRSAVFRIISLTLAGGDMIQTIPGTWALYRKQWVQRRLSALCFFYAMARYMSILSLGWNGYDFFSRSYTLASCKHLYMFPNVTALLAGMAVQVLVYMRTVAISDNSKYVRIGLGAVMLLGFPVQTFGVVYHRQPRFKNASCKGKVLHPGEPDWNIVFYSSQMFFDFMACAIATYYLVCVSRVPGGFRFSKLGRSILTDGLLYFLVVFLTNLWVVLEFASVFSSGAASALPLAVVLIATIERFLNLPVLTDGPTNVDRQEMLLDFSVHNPWGEMLVAVQHIPGKQLPQVLADRLFGVSARWNTKMTASGRTTYDEEERLYYVAAAGNAVQLLSTLCTHFINKSAVISDDTQKKLSPILEVWAHRYNGQFLGDVSHRMLNYMSKVADSEFNKVRKLSKNWEVCALPSCNIRKNLKVCGR
ncbi:hypothetical protein C8R45DRAFT_1207424 [Mycena sanguinolenta]|nr:hypothetical protein C8R45DRAFT_1207424 [Mycena sanguinolenta]